jgi:hypothetical protein
LNQWNSNLFEFNYIFVQHHLIFSLKWNLTFTSSIHWFHHFHHFIVIGIVWQARAQVCKQIWLWCYIVMPKFGVLFWGGLIKMCGWSLTLCAKVYLSHLLHDHIFSIWVLVDRLEEVNILSTCIPRSSYYNVMILGFEMHGEICPNHTCHILKFECNVCMGSNVFSGWWYYQIDYGKSIICVRNFERITN